MEVQLKVTDKLWLKFEGADQKEVFRQIAKEQEIFGMTECGACKTANPRYVVRNVVDGKKTYEYFELHCQNQQCRAKLSFGCHQEGGGLFPKRKDGEAWLENNGWVKYKKPENAT